MTNTSTGARTRSQAAVLAVAVLAGSSLGAGCSSEPDTLSPSPSSSAASATSEPADPREAVEAAYDRYWDTVHSIDRDPVATWQDQLARVATPAQAKTTYRAARFQRTIGEAVYGNVTARVSDVTVRGRNATLVDCQDASESGVENAETGKPKTVGIARNPIRARLNLDATEQRWKVDRITYPGGDC